MSDSDFALRLASPSELREMVQTLTRERDEARRLHMGQAGRAAGWRARARYAREALERLIELVADDPEAKDTTTPLYVAVTVARAEVTAIEEAERRDADRSTPPLELTVREAARQRVPLDGADAQALEGALALTERERDEVRAEVERLRAALAGEGEAPTCTWTQDDEGVWHTACRSSWLYPDGGSPADHRQVYCHACGQRVEAEPYAGELPEVKGGRDA